MDLIGSGDSRWKTLHDPTRPFPEDFHRDGEGQSLVSSIEDNAPDCGGLVEKNGEKLAVHRDGAGGLRAVSASCTHKGCAVTWNNADSTWNRPCHGSIFSADGSVLHGPAREPLPPAEL